MSCAQRIFFISHSPKKKNLAPSVGWNRSSEPNKSPFNSHRRVAASLRKLLGTNVKSMRHDAPRDGILEFAEWRTANRSRAYVSEGIIIEKGRATPPRYSRCTRPS